MTAPDTGEVAMSREGAAAARGYANSQEHLWHHLARISCLYRAQTVRWHHEIAAHKPSELWGMIHVSDAEIDALLNAPFLPPDAMPAQLEQALRPLWTEFEDAGVAIDDRTAATSAATDLRLARLERDCGLTALERDALLVCLLPELDGRYRRLVGYLLDDATRMRPTMDLVLQILRPALPDLAAGRALFAPEGRLARLHMVRLGENGLSGEASADRTVTLDGRIVAHLLGDDRPDFRLRGLVACGIDPPRLGGLVLDETLRIRAAALPRWLDGRRSGTGGTMLFLHGPYGSGRQSLAAAVTAETSRPMLMADATTLPSDDAGWRQTVELSYREALLLGADLFFGSAECLLTPAGEPGSRRLQWDILLTLAEETRTCTWIASDVAWYPAGRFRGGGFLCIDIPAPKFDLRRRLWEKHLPPPGAFAQPAPDRDQLVALLANAFQFNAGQIVDAVSLAQGLAARRRPDDPRLGADLLYEACRRQTGERLIRLASRVEPDGKLDFNQLVLRSDNRRQIDELRTRIRLRNAVYGGLGFEDRVGGKGLIALFTGTSGTGKTMAAQLLAEEQGVDLYKVDLSAVVSKYVGETEKNLGRIFAEAEDANAILFFDEADALFGKRGDVKEARDRWANLEVNYLLQRVEEYSGVVILATNLRQNIDEAFLRRIHMIVEFPFPDATARKKIWRGMFPKGVKPPPDTVIADLADRFELPGGSIRNITIDAAFRALDRSDKVPPAITARHLILSICREYLKLGKPVTESAFGEKYYKLVNREILSNGD